MFHFRSFAMIYELNGTHKNKEFDLFPSNSVHPMIIADSIHFNKIPRACRIFPRVNTLPADRQYRSQITLERRRCFCKNVDSSSGCGTTNNIEPASLFAALVAALTAVLVAALVAALPLLVRGLTALLEAPLVLVLLATLVAPLVSQLVEAVI